MDFIVQILLLTSKRLFNYFGIALMTTSAIFAEELNQVNSEIALINNCHIELFETVYKASTDATFAPSDIIKNSNCPANLQKEISQELSKMLGSVSTERLQEEIKLNSEITNRNSPTITFSSKRITITVLEDFLKNEFKQKTSYVFTDIRPLNGKQFISLDHFEKISLSNTSDILPGERNIKITITNLNTNEARAQWITTKVYIKVKVLKTKVNLTPNLSALSSSLFYQDEVLTYSSENYLTDLNQISFYQVNKNILPDSVIFNHDLRPINLINYGTPVTVILKSENISLQKSMMPMRSAKLNETINFQGPQNKIISGKVIDFNRAVINL